MLCSGVLSYIIKEKKKPDKIDTIKNKITKQKCKKYFHSIYLEGVY